MASFLHGLTSAVCVLASFNVATIVLFLIIYTQRCVQKEKYLVNFVTLLFYSAENVPVKKYGSPMVTLKMAINDLLLALDHMLWLTK